MSKYSVYSVNLQKLTKELFPDEVALVEGGQCPSCKKAVSSDCFQDDLSLVEFRISGLCQECQDDFFEDVE